jgi:hypothetical protein
MWAQLINGLLGIWLMAAPSVFGYVGTAAEDNGRIIGPIVGTFGIIAVWEVTRGCRWLILPLGLWMLVAPWILGYAHGIAIANDMAIGALAAGLSLVKGKMPTRMGGGWRVLFGPTAASDV